MVLPKPVNQAKKYIFIVLFLSILAVLALLKKYSDTQIYKNIAKNSSGIAPITTAAYLEEAGGHTEADFDLSSLKRMENVFVDASVKTTREIYARTGKDVSKFNPHVISNSQFVTVRGKKLGVVKLSVFVNENDQKNAVKIARIVGFTRRGVETVSCFRYGDEEIPVFIGVCGDKIREVFGVSMQ